MRVPSLLRRSAGLVIASALVGLPAASPVAAAATITVNSLADTTAADASCTLREAIAAANSNVAANGCSAGSGTDTIVFSVSGYIDLVASLPAIASSLTIDGASKVEINGNGAWRPFAVTAGTVTLKRLRVSNAHAATTGGALSVSGGTVTVADAAFTGNGASAGGAIHNGATLSVLRTTFTANAVSGNGGAINNTGTLTVADSTLDGGTAIYAGGIYNDGGTLTMTGSLVTGSQTSWTAGIVNNGGTVTIANSTFAGNTAANGPSAIANASGSALTLANVTVTGNTGTQLGAVYDGGGTFVMRNTLVIGNTGGNVSGTPDTSVANITAIPGGKTIDDFLDPDGLQANGGPTKTVDLVRVAANTAIGAGDPTACTTAPVGGKDQRGFTRTTTCDIGAVELENTPPVPAAPVARPLSGHALQGGNQVVTKVSWGATDTGGSGVATYDVVYREGTSGWQTFGTGLAFASAPLALKLNLEYRFGVRARDNDGNVSSIAYGPAFTIRYAQDTSSSVTYVKTWTKASATAYFGGSVHAASSSGASATYTFTGRSIAFLSTKGPTRGKAKIYVNGVYIQTIDLATAVTQPREVVFTRSWSTSGTRTIKVVVLGTSGRPRVDLDAFIAFK